jgi:AraC-like DNA-binding protein
MAAEPLHRCRVVAPPCAGFHVTSTESGRHFGRHWHATYGLGFLAAGAHSSASGRGPVEAFAGDILTTNPGEVHDGRPLGGSSRYWHTIYAEPQALQRLLDDGVTAHELEQPVLRDPQLLIQLQRSLTRLLGEDGAVPLAAEEALVQVFGLAFSRHASRREQPCPGANVARVHERLADAALVAPSLSELAALAQLSKFQLLRRFRQAYGMTPFAWLQLQRAERARACIAAGASLADAAAIAGFADQSHMTRVFARQFGFTPGAWRRAAAPQ